jgi:hypothetical protein
MNISRVALVKSLYCYISSVMENVVEVRESVEALIVPGNSKGGTD